MNHRKKLESPGTKREFLGCLASLFDPLGLVGPLTLAGKILLQKMWKVPDLNWDGQLPDALKDEAERWCESVLSLPISFPRNCNLKKDDVVFHVFVDSSELGYGACVYAVSNNESHIVCAKSRVAPTKNVSLPRLELCAAVLGAELFDVIATSLHLTNPVVHFWSDSSVTLCWIKSPSYQWSTFVANRVSTIQRLSNPDSWHFVKGSINIADLISRGTLDLSDMRCSLWQKGPKFLLNPDDWPDSVDLFVTDLERKKKAEVLTVSQEKNGDMFSHISSWHLLIGVVARILSWSRPANVKAVDLWSEAEIVLLRLIQSESFHEEIAMLKKGDKLKRSSCLFVFDPQLDEQGLMRVGGRLSRSRLPWESQHPVILPRSHRYVEMMVQRVHLDTLHGGTEMMSAELRKRFWILKGKILAKSVKSRCPTCIRFDSSLPSLNENVAPLPPDRSTLSSSFSSVGCDFCGPFAIKVKNKVEKMYILLFVCATTRAVHLEVTSSLSSDDFLLAYRRFVARRCVPKLIRSDNAMTFKKASKILKIPWLFNAPSAPWWGGFFEIMVKLIKKPLKKVLKNALLSKEEFISVVYEVEKIVNNRPLTPVSSDVNDELPLTPSMLMGNVFSSGFASDSLSSSQMTRRHRYILKVVSGLKRRWHFEYLAALNQGRKRFYAQGEVKVGDLCYLDNGKHRVDFPLVRVVQVEPGPDGKIRLVKIKCGDKLFWRAIQRLIPLEMNRFPHG